MLLLLLVGCPGKGLGETGLVDTAPADDTAVPGNSGLPDDTAYPVIWEGEEGAGIGWGLAIATDVDGSGTPAVIVAARGAGAIEARGASGEVLGAVALDTVVWLAMLDDDGVAALAWNEDDADVYLIDGPLLAASDAEADARAIVRGLDCDGLDKGFSGGGDATGDGASDWLTMDVHDVRLFDGSLVGEHTSASAAATILQDTSAWATPVPTHLADLDADGVADVIVSRGTLGAGASVFRGPVSGERSITDADLAIGGEGSELCSFFLASGDIDGDGRQELACDVSWTDVVVLPAGADGQIGADGALAHAATDAEMIWNATADADLDGDGITDLLLAEPTYGDVAGRVGVLYGPLTGTLAAPSWTATGTPDAALGYALATGDLDADGLGDAVAGAPGYDGWAGAIYVLSGGR